VARNKTIIPVMGNLKCGRMIFSFKVNLIEKDKPKIIWQTQVSSFWALKEKT
jgi:hypothetical protein